MSLSLSDSVKLIILKRVVTEIAALTDNAAATLFATVKRGFPAPQTLADVDFPAAYVVDFNERPHREGIEELEMNDLPFGVIIFARRPADEDQEDTHTDLLQLEAKVRDLLSDTTLNGYVQNVRWFGTDTPLANPNLPMGTVMPAFVTLYGTDRTDPFTS